MSWKQFPASVRSWSKWLMCAGLMVGAWPVGSALGETTAAPVAAVPMTPHSSEVMAVPMDTSSAMHGNTGADGSSPMFIGFADYLYWNVHGVDLPFAQPFNGIDPLTSTPHGTVGVASPQYTSGIRVGAGVAVSDNSWVVGTFTYFRTNSGVGIEAKGDDVLHNFLAFPNTVNSAGGAAKASGHYNIDLTSGDLDYVCDFICTDKVQLAWVMGARYAHLDQKFLAIFSVPGTTEVATRVNFDGGGPRVGLWGDYQVGCGIFGCARGMLNLLAGDFRASDVENSKFGGLLGQTNVDEERLVPILELEVGMGWQSHNGCLRISGGYYVGTWFNTMTTPGLVESVQNTNFTTNGNNFRDTLSFDGLVGRIEVRY